MFGFITNDFSNIKEELLFAISQIDPLAPLPALILCHSSIEIKFLKYFFAKHQISVSNVSFYTFKGLISKLSIQYLPDQHLTNCDDIRLLAQNQNIYLDLHSLAEHFLKPQSSEIDPSMKKAINFLTRQTASFGWITPSQALKKLLALIPQIFSTCILYDYSSQDDYSLNFLSLIEKISEHTLYFAFDRCDQDSIFFNCLEENFGNAKRIYKTSANSEIYFSIVMDSIDGARYGGELISNYDTSTTIAIICPFEVSAKLVANELNRRNIRYHNGFKTHIADPLDLLVFAWYQFQIYGDLDHFLVFLDLIAIGNPSFLSENYYEYLSHLFHRYPINSIQLLLPHIEDPKIVAILSQYPFLPEQAPMDEFVRKTISIIPEIYAQASHFNFDLPMQKNAFLEYALSIYYKTKSSTKEPFYSPIFLTDMYSAKTFHFDQAIVLCDNIVSKDKTKSDMSEILFPFLNATTIHFIAEKNNIPIDFVQQYQSTYGQILDNQIIQSLTKSLIVYDGRNIEPKKYEFLKQINEQRNSQTLNFGTFEYMTENIKNLPLPITAIEHAFAEPEEIWYRHVLKNYRPPLEFDKAKFAGIFTHQFLRWSKEDRPSIEEFKVHISQKQKQFQQMFLEFSPGLLLQEAMSSEDAYILAEKITQFDTFPFMTSELDLRSTMALSNDTMISLHGRIDCILSERPLRREFNSDNAKNRIIVIDLKTGSTTQNSLIKLTKPFSDLPTSLTGLQLILYGLILKNIGYQDIQLLILNADPYDNVEPISLQNITQSENFSLIQNFLKKLLVEGIFGYGESNSFLQNHFLAPIATILPNNEIIHEKRKKLLSK